MDTRHFFRLLVLTLFSLAGGIATTRQSVANQPFDLPRRADISTRHVAVQDKRVAAQSSDPNCREWKDESCLACGTDTVLNISVRNKTKTPLLLCRNMRPGPARVEMIAHAEPVTPGLWEVEFGLGYLTSGRSECPHQFIASNSPPLRLAYDVGPVSIESEIPVDGTIQALACVGLSSARVGKEGKETGASLRVIRLLVVSE